MLDRRFIAILAIEFCFQMGSFLVNPIVSSYVVAIGGAVVIGGLLAGLNSVSALAARPLVGAVVDRASLPKLLAVAGALSFLSSFLCVFAQDVVVVALCRVAFGVAFAFKSTIVVALARLVLPQNRVGAGLSTVSLLYVLANALGPLVGTELGARFGYHVCFFLSAAMFAAALALNIFLLAGRSFFSCGDASKAKNGCGDQSQGGKDWLGFVYRPVLGLTVMSGMVAFTLGSTNTLLVLAMGDRNIEGLSLFFLVAALSMLISRPLAGKLCDRYGFSRVFAPSSISALLAMVCLAYAQSLFLVVAAAVLLAFGQCTLTVLIQSEGMRNVSEKHVGKASNTLFLGPDIGMFLGPAIGGVVLQTFGSCTLFLVNAGLVGMMAALFFLIVRTRS